MLILEHGSPAFEEFLDFIGERVELKGFSKYRAGLDTKSENEKQCYIVAFCSIAWAKTCFSYEMF